MLRKPTDVKALELPNIPERVLETLSLCLMGHCYMVGKVRVLNLRVQILALQLDHEKIKL